MNMPNKLTRRTLLTATASVASAQSTRANSAVSVALIGCGGRGRTLMRDLVSHTPARLSAVCDLRPERMRQARAEAEERGAKPAVNGSMESVLASPDIDAVIVATPVFLHADHLEAAVRAGKHVYIEKPAMPDVAGCKRMMRIADSADRKLNLTIGFQRRYGQVYFKAKALLDSGAAGALRLVHLHFIKSSSWNQKPRVPEPRTEDEKIRGWHVWSDLSGDLIVENNIHLIDVMNWFVGSRPASAIGAGGRNARKIGDMRDHGNVSFLFENGVQGALIGTTLAPSFYRNVHEQYFCETGVIETAAEYWKHYRGRNDSFEEASPRNVTTDALEAFVKRIAEGKPENTIVRGAESTLTAILGRMAMEARREVTWDEMMQSA